MTAGAAPEAEDDIPEPPAGFVRASGRGAFNAHNGPFFRRLDGAQAFFALERHCNALGLIHGGMLSTFLDGVLAAAAARGAAATPVTVHLSIDFLAMARAREWVIGEANLTRVATDLAFVDGQLHAGDRTLARATGVFKLMRRRRR